jgi:ATP-dependent Lon protease
LHVHVPSGAIPKDGPSAGVAMVTALVSLLSGKSVRPRVAMTGEISLSGIVLPVGGIKEKVLGAKRAGIREVILPADNEPNVKEDLPEDLLGGVQVHFVRTAEEALEIALGKFEKPVQATKRGPSGGEDRPMAGPVH